MAGVEDVARIITELPGVVDSTQHANRAWSVGGNAWFACASRALADTYKKKRESGSRSASR